MQGMLVPLRTIGAHCSATQDLLLLRKVSANSCMRSLSIIETSEQGVYTPPITLTNPTVMCETKAPSTEYVAPLLTGIATPKPLGAGACADT